MNNNTGLKWEDDDDDSDDDSDNVESITASARRDSGAVRGASRRSLDEIESLEQEFAAELQNLQSEFFDMSTSHRDDDQLELSQRHYDESDSDDEGKNPFLGPTSGHSRNLDNSNNSNNNNPPGLVRRSQEEEEDSAFWEENDPSLANLNESFTLRSNSGTDGLLDVSDPSNASPAPQPLPTNGRSSIRKKSPPPPRRSPPPSHTTSTNGNTNSNIMMHDLMMDGGPQFNLVDVSHRDVTESSQADEEEENWEGDGRDTPIMGTRGGPGRRSSQNQQNQNQNQQRQSSVRNNRPPPPQPPRRPPAQNPGYQPTKQQQPKPAPPPPPQQQQQRPQPPPRNSRHTRKKIKIVKPKEEEPEQQEVWEQQQHQQEEEDEDDDEDQEWESESDSSDSETISSQHYVDEDTAEDGAEEIVDWLDESNRGKYATSSRGLLGNSSRMTNASGHSHHARRGGGRRRQSSYHNNNMNGSSRRQNHHGGGPMNGSSRRGGMNESSRRSNSRGQIFAGGQAASGSTKGTTFTAADDQYEDPLLIVDKTPNMIPEQHSGEYYYEGEGQEEFHFVDDENNNENGRNSNRPGSNSNNKSRRSSLASLMDWNAWWIGMLALCCCCVVLILVIILPIYFLVIKDSSSSNNGETTLSPAGTPAPTGYIIPLSIYSMESIEQNLLSPQARAYDWLLKDPNLNSYDEHRKMQRFALATLYYSFRGENWTSTSKGNQQNWLNYDADECTWVNTRCEDVNSAAQQQQEGGGETASNKNIFDHSNNNNENKADAARVGSSQRQLLRRNLQTQIGVPITPKLSVVTINLHKNNLVGSIPAEIELLSELRSLDLGYNTIFSNLPIEIEGMRNLVYLNLTNNLIDGDIPWISSPLEIIDVSHNQFNVSIPNWFGSLKTLETLDLSYNKFIGPFPQSTMSWEKSLKTLRLHYNQLTGRLPNEVGFLSTVEVFEADHNNLNGTLPTQLGAMLMLKEVALYNNDFSGPIPSEIGKLDQLQRLELIGNRLNGTLPPQFGSLTQLETLWLYDNELSGKIPPQMGSLPALQHVILYNNEFTGSLPIEFCSIDQLQIDCPSLCGCNCTCPSSVDSTDGGIVDSNSTEAEILQGDPNSCSCNNITDQACEITGSNSGQVVDDTALCEGEESCKGATITNCKKVICNGKDACSKARISSGYCGFEGTELKCINETSCAEAIAEGFSSIICNGREACSVFKPACGTMTCNGLAACAFIGSTDNENCPLCSLEGTPGCVKCGPEGNECLNLTIPGAPSGERENFAPANSQYGIACGVNWTSNFCEGRTPDLSSVQCTDDDGVPTAGEQSPVNVTKGYNGLLNATASPWRLNFTSALMCPVNVNWRLGAEHYSLGYYDENGVGPTQQQSQSLSQVGYQCYHYNESDPRFTTEYNWDHCENMQVGQTYEIQWPHSTAGYCVGEYQYQSPAGDGMFCGMGFDSLSNTIRGLQGQVGIQAQVFTVVNDEDFYYSDLISGMIVYGEWGTDLAMYTGSTTTPFTTTAGSSSSAPPTAFDNTDNCSPISPITWHVDRVCHLISASSFDKLCADMKAQADDMSGDIFPHAPRELVSDSLAANNHIV